MKFGDIKWELKFPELQDKDIPGMEEMKAATGAQIQFDNGYGVSIILGALFYSNGVDTYELAILHHGELCYSTDITNDVMGYLTQDQLMDTIHAVEALPQNL